MTEKAELTPTAMEPIKLAPGVRITAQLNFGHDPQRKIEIMRTTHEDGLVLHIPLADVGRNSFCRMYIKKSTALELAALLKEFGES